MLLIDANPSKFKGDKCCYLAAFVACSLALPTTYSCSLVNSVPFSFWLIFPSSLVAFIFSLKAFVISRTDRCGVSSWFNGLFWPVKPTAFRNVIILITPFLYALLQGYQVKMWVVSTIFFPSRFSDLPKKKQTFRKLRSDLLYTLESQSGI